MPSALTPLAKLVRDRLHAMGLSATEAARLTGINHKTLDGLTKQTTSRKVTPQIRAQLRRLGLTEAEIEYAAALTAGYKVTPPDIEPREWAQLLRLRRLNEARLRYINDEIERFLTTRPGRS